MFFGMLDREINTLYRERIKVGIHSIVAKFSIFLKNQGDTSQSKDVRDISFN